MARMTDEEFKLAAERINTARKAIVQDAGGGKPRSKQGEITCPVCTTGKLKYSIASNAHIWAGCSTEDCVRWLE